MGFYINPPNMSKEDFLRKFGVHHRGVPTSNVDADRVAVCLVDNGMFTAAGICYSQAELEAFAQPDGRPKMWFYVPVELLRGDLHAQKVEGIDT